MIIFDLETTGLNPGTDEIVQISIINENQDVLLYSLVKPDRATEWPAAQQVNGISPDMVKGAPSIYDLAPKIYAIFEKEDCLVTYNGAFDLAFLENFIPEKQYLHYDVMRLFAPIYGEWSDHYDSYKWQKLSTCASYYGYEFNPHDALEDCKATLHCFNSMKLKHPEVIR